MDDDQTRRIYELRCELSRTAIQAQQEIQRLRHKAMNLEFWLGLAGSYVLWSLVRHYHLHL